MEVATQTEVPAGTLITEETGVSMLIGVAVGYELAKLLMDPTEGD